MTFKYSTPTNIQHTKLFNAENHSTHKNKTSTTKRKRIAVVCDPTLPWLAWPARNTVLRRSATQHYDAGAIQGGLERRAYHLILDQSYKRCPPPPPPRECWGRFNQHKVNTSLDIKEEQKHNTS